MNNEPKPGQVSEDTVEFDPRGDTEKLVDALNAGIAEKMSQMTDDVRSVLQASLGPTARIIHYEPTPAGPFRFTYEYMKNGVRVEETIDAGETSHAFS